MTTLEWSKKKYENNFLRKLDFSCDNRECVFLKKEKVDEN